uniref:C-type lectin domain-containing protein n=1 Tax=Panagrellus redivivus TaxID=6233 RepID=A0A7E4WC22_PANRE
MTNVFFLFFVAINIIAMAKAASLRCNDDASTPAVPTPSPTISAEDCANLKGIKSHSTGQCFLFVRSNITFIQAESFCENFYSGHLASIHSAFDNLYVADHARETFGSDNQFYIGLTSLESANYTWQDGTAVDYTDFVDNTNNGYQCTTVSLKTGTWIKTECFNTVANFVCSL